MLSFILFIVALIAVVYLGGAVLTLLMALITVGLKIVAFIIIFISAALAGLYNMVIR